MAELEADQDYQDEIRTQDEQLERKAVAWRRAEAPLVDELRAAGFEVESAWDFVNTPTPYPAALPILLEHLQRPYPDRVREGIARALAVRDAKFGWDTLVRLYRKEAVGSDAKDGLAVALAATADEDVADELIDLASDAVHGESRLLLLRGLKRLKAPHARAALGQFAADPGVGRGVATAPRGRSINVAGNLAGGAEDVPRLHRARKGAGPRLRPHHRRPSQGGVGKTTRR